MVLHPPRRQERKPRHPPALVDDAWDLREAICTLCGLGPLASRWRLDLDDLDPAIIHVMINEDLHAGNHRSIGRHYWLGAMQIGRPRDFINKAAAVTQRPPVPSFRGHENSVDGSPAISSLRKR